VQLTIAVNVSRSIGVINISLLVTFTVIKMRSLPYCGLLDQSRLLEAGSHKLTSYKVTKVVNAKNFRC